MSALVELLQNHLIAADASIESGCLSDPNNLVAQTYLRPMHSLRGGWHPEQAIKATEQALR